MNIEIGSPEIIRVVEFPGIFRGTLEFRAPETLGDVKVAQVASVTVRFAHEVGATYEALEARLLKEAARLLSHAAQRAAEGRGNLEGNAPKTGSEADPSKADDYRAVGPDDHDAEDSWRVA